MKVSDYKDNYENAATKQRYNFQSLTNRSIKHGDKSICNDDEVNEIIVQYAKACVNLYGLIHVSDFIFIFNEHNKIMLEADFVTEFLGQSSHTDSVFTVWNEYIANTYFLDNDFEEAEDILDEIEEIDMYIPEKEELLLYIDSEYFEHTKETKAFCDYVYSLGYSDIHASDICTTVCSFCRIDVYLYKIIEFLLSVNLDVENTDNGKKIMDLITDVKNNTRSWERCGHKPSEIGEEYELHKF